MFSFNKPSAGIVEVRSAELKDKPFSYLEVGRIRINIPGGYNIDHHQVHIGNGQDVFNRSKQMLAEWRMMETGWTSIWPSKPSLSEGTVVGILVNIMGIWIVNMARIVCRVEESNSEKDLYGFAYGTLAQHVEKGEEQFLITWDHKDDSVWFGIKAFSKPSSLLIWLGYPYVRFLQKRFAKDALAAFSRAVG